MAKNGMSFDSLFHFLLINTINRFQRSLVCALIAVKCVSTQSDFHDKHPNVCLELYKMPCGAPSIFQAKLILQCFLFMDLKTAAAQTCAKLSYVVFSDRMSPYGTRREGARAAATRPSNTIGSVAR